MKLADGYLDNLVQLKIDSAVEDHSRLGER